jgi:hypothetical protein
MLFAHGTASIRSGQAGRQPGCVAKIYGSGDDVAENCQRHAACDRPLSSSPMKLREGSDLVATAPCKPAERQAGFTVHWIRSKFFDHSAFQILARILRPGDELDPPKHICVCASITLGGGVGFISVCVVCGVDGALCRRRKSLRPNR